MKINLINSLDDLSPRNYWTLIKTLLGNQFLLGIPALENNGQIANTDLEKVNIFLGKFLTKFHHEISMKLTYPYVL
jgi:hypothetical protein